MTKALLLFPFIFLSLHQALLAQSPRLIKEETFVWDRTEEFWWPLNFTDYTYLDAFGSHEKKYYTYDYNYLDHPPTVLESKVFIKKDALNLVTNKRITAYEYNYATDILENITLVKTSQTYTTDHQLASFENTFHNLSLQEEELDMYSANRGIYTFDDNQCITSYIFENGSTDGTQVVDWEGFSFSTRSNTENCELLELIGHYFQDNAPVPVSKKTYETETNGDTIRKIEITEDWNASEAVWMLKTRTDRLEVYNEIGQVTYSEYRINNDIPSRTFYSYDAQDSLSEKRREYFSLDLNEWKSINLTTYSYNDHTTEVISNTYSSTGYVGLRSTVITVVNNRGHLLSKSETKKYYNELGLYGQTYFAEIYNRLCDGTVLEYTKIDERNLPTDNFKRTDRIVYTYTGIPPCDQAWDEDTNIHVFPNPSTGLFNIESTLLTQSDARISVFNTLGQQLFKTTYNGQEGWYTLDLPGLPLGSYHLMIEAGGERRSHSIVIGQ